MSGKSGKVVARVAGMDAKGWDPRYAGWFECFNRGEYFEAHDVLEDLWLEQGRDAPDHGFHKGLIQVAGAFVHARKGRPGPAVALLRLARSYLGRFPAWHQGLDVGQLLSRCQHWESGVLATGVSSMLDGPPPQVVLTPRAAAEHPVTP
jgi:predicted metal-dependent hydrolase